MKKTDLNLNRRKFLSMAGLATTAGLTGGPAWAANTLSDVGSTANQPSVIESVKDIPVPPNKAATIIESKTILKQAGTRLGYGTEYKLNTNGHVVISNKVIEPNRYIGWPTLAKTKEGELIVAFSGDRDAHVCPWGKTQIIRSNDQGKTWSAVETVNNTPLDDRDAGILQTAKGTLLVSWFTSLAFENPKYEAAFQRYSRVGEKMPKETREKWLGNWVRRSEDGGKTWLEPSRTTVSAPHGPMQLKDGRLLYIGNGYWKGDKNALLIEESADDGRTWKVIAHLPRPAGSIINLNEPHLLELKSGKILAMVRHEPKDISQCFLMQSESTDGGKSWTPLHQTPIWGYPPHLTLLKNGWVMVVYGYRREPFGERACISRDEGKTWDIDNEIILTGAASRDLGYPSSVQLDDKSILTVYYQAEKFGEAPSLMSTHWKLK
jgi:hypothetical protein